MFIKMAFPAFILLMFFASYRKEFMEKNDFCRFLVLGAWTLISFVNVPLSLDHGMSISTITWDTIKYSALLILFGLLIHNICIPVDIYMWKNKIFLTISNIFDIRLYLSHGYRKEVLKLDRCSSILMDRLNSIIRLNNPETPLIFIRQMRSLIDKMEEEKINLEYKHQIIQGGLDIERSIKQLNSSRMESEKLDNIMLEQITKNNIKIKYLERGLLK